MRHLQHATRACVPCLHEALALALAPPAPLPFRATFSLTTPPPASASPRQVRNRWHRLQKTHALGNGEEGDAALDALLSASGVGGDGTVPGSVTSMSLDVAPIPEGEPVEDIERKTGSAHGRSMWTAEEDRLIEEGVRRFGCKWRQIATALPGRSDSSIRNRWMRLQKERTMARGSPQQTGAGAATWDGGMAVTGATAAAPSPVLAPAQPAHQPPVAKVFGHATTAAAGAAAPPVAWSAQQPGAMAAATAAPAVATSVNLAQRLGSQPTVRAPDGDAEETGASSALPAPSAAPGAEPLGFGAPLRGFDLGSFMHAVTCAVEPPSAAADGAPAQNEDDLHDLFEVCELAALAAPAPLASPAAALSGDGATGAEPPRCLRLASALLVAMSALSIGATLAGSR